MARLREIRDSVHVFVRVDERLANVIESLPIQRLRGIHQLGLSYLVYPGASHTRFEHSLGVMELAGRVFDVVTAQENTSAEVKEQLPQLKEEQDLKSYWRRVVQAAALCHDIGHIPFSHAAEKQVLPEGWNHERLSRALILSDILAPFWKDERPPLQPEDVAKLAVGKEKAPEVQFSTWEAILSEIIVGDSFGVDRMDYLLRDSYHMGVPYGRFDHFRLIDTLRILPAAPAEGLNEPSLGVEQGGLQSAEALLLARYFMYSQVYFHRVRISYDVHLVDFMKATLPGGVYSVSLEEHLASDDSRLLTRLHEAAAIDGHAGQESAQRILKRRQFRSLWERNPSDIRINSEAGNLIFEAAKDRFGEEKVRHRGGEDTGGNVVFPVLSRDGKVGSSASMSEVLSKLPAVKYEYVLVAPETREEAERWLAENKDDMIRVEAEE